MLSPIDARSRLSEFFKAGVICHKTSVRPRNSFFWHVSPSDDRKPAPCSARCKPTSLASRPFGRWGFSHTATSAVLMKCVRRYALRPTARTATSPPDCCCPSVAVTNSSTAVRCFNPFVNTTTPNFEGHNYKQGSSSESRLAFKSGHLVDPLKGTAA